METEKKGFILSLYPTTKLFFCVAFIILAFILPSFQERLILVLVIHILAMMSGVYKNFFKISVAAFGILLVFIMLMQSLFYQGVSNNILFEFGIFSIKYEGIINGLNISSSVLVFGSAIILFFQTTKVKELVHALENSGMNPKATYVILATLQMVPQMRKSSQVIMSAQRARGVETEGNLFVRMKAFIPILFPLILSSIASTEEKALTLEARGFSIAGNKTQLMVLEKRSIDKVLQILIILVTLAIIIWRVALWL